MSLHSVPSFEASKYPITNGEYLEFVVTGGYTRRDLWSKEGWEWVQSRQARHPTFWICSHGFTSPQFRLRFALLTAGVDRLAPITITTVKLDRYCNVYGKFCRLYSICSRYTLINVLPDNEKSSFYKPYVSLLTYSKGYIVYNDILWVFRGKA